LFRLEDATDFGSVGLKALFELSHQVGRACRARLVAKRLKLRDDVTQEVGVAGDARVASEADCVPLLLLVRRATA
jgi:hypothetical protein